VQVVVALEGQHVQQGWHDAAVVMAVGRARHPLHLGLVLFGGLGLMNQVVQGLLADNWVDHVLDHAIRLRPGRFGEGVQQLGLADHLLRVCHQRGVHLFFGSYAHAMCNMHQQLERCP
jgi:hypothetical protein